MALDGCSGIRRIDADLRSRQLTIVHEGNADEIEAVLQPLNLGARVSDSGPTTESQADEPNALANVAEARTLRIVLAINAAMFVAELLGAFFADSSALLADSLDMFADAVVYGLALFGVHRARSTQLKAAHLSGILQLLLALGAFSEIVRRLIFGSEPEAGLMVLVSLAALAANITCMLLLARHRHGGAHMKASWIFTTNDVIANIGVIVAGVLVSAFNSGLPDLVIATVIAFVVLTGAIRILRMK